MAEHPPAPNPPEPIAQPDGDGSAEAIDTSGQAMDRDAGRLSPTANSEASAHSGAPHEILAVAVFEPLEGMETQALATVRELSTVLERGGYSRDVLYREPEGAYVLVRYWKSDDARRHAPEDPDAQRCWARLAHEIRILKIYERLEEVER
jgi:hypothetical protein